MTTKDINNWIMYHEIHKLSRNGMSPPKIAEKLVMDARTVRKYLKMTELDFENLLLAAQARTKKLSPYEKFVKERLEAHPETGAAQMHDWLKENHPDFPFTQPRTVYNFVMHVRAKYSIPLVKPVRDYFPVSELPFGEQAQADFGEYSIRRADGSRIKVRFFVTILSRSRMKFVWFSDKPFTTAAACAAHEKAFGFYGGMPQTMVYDQDRVFITDENLGEYLLTEDFRKYTRSRNFKLHFCRKSDPESKGKVENTVKYVKRNFLFNRVFIDLETLNVQVAEWLVRTANIMPHGVTKRSPESEFALEKPFLKPFTAPATEISTGKLYNLRKNNTIAYKSNFYSLPQGTYRGAQTQVLVCERNQSLEICSGDGKLICTHVLCAETGKIIVNTNHRRYNTQKINELQNTALALFTNPADALKFFEAVRTQYPRYVRDHAEAVISALKGLEKSVADKVLAFCLENQIVNGSDFASIVPRFTSQQTIETHNIKLLNKDSAQKAADAPQTSDIEYYETILNRN